MTQPQWSRLEELFHAAIGLDEPERVAFLDAECAGDSGLRSELDRLLAADARADGVIEETVRSSAAVAAGSRVGQRIGPYRLVEEIGHGGMSSVYLGVRSDDQFEQRVAIKLVRFNAAGSEVSRRLLAERQILAQLEHPHIARLYDGGTTADGTPYFVMEYIDGVPIDEYCDSRRLSVAERLELFRKVCAAVHHAHRNLVVHRDLKPSNVLVTADGVPKLLDFGIAKLLDPQGFGRSDEPTTMLLRMGTPGYASPEQLRGGAVTTASDTYSLGVLLYRLITGSEPFSVDRQTSIEEIARLQTRGPLRRPSVAAEDAGAGAAAARRETPDSLARRLRGDLDNIAAMMLEPEPANRYGSVQQVAEDLARTLGGHPVIARPDTVGYRCRKFLLRHRLGVALATLALLVVSGFAVAMGVSRARTARERDRAEAVSSMLVDLFELAGPAGVSGMNLTAHDLLDRGVEQVDALDDQPETQAMLRDTLGGLFEQLGFYGEAQALFEQAVDGYRRALGAKAPEVAVSLQHQARATARKGEFAAAETLFRETLALQREVLGRDRPEVARTLNGLGLVLHEQGDFAAAEPLYREALALETRLSGADSPRAAVTMGNLALLLADSGKFAEAEELYRQLLASAADAEMAAEAGDGLGLCLLAQGRFAEARAAFEEALGHRRDYFGGDHPLVARTLGHLGDAVREAGDLAAAEPILAEAYEMAARLLGDGHAELADHLAAFGSLRLEQGRTAEAELLLRRAGDLYGRSFPADHPFVGRPLADLGRLLAEAGRCQEATPVLADALAALPSWNRRREPARNALERCGSAAR